MPNISVKSDNSSLYNSDDIAEAVFKRAINVINDDVFVEVIIDPILTNYSEVQSIGGNPSKYLIDEDELIDSETLVRLATFNLPEFKKSILFIFHKTNKHNDKVPTKIDLSKFQYQDESTKQSSEFLINLLRKKKASSLWDNYNLIFICGASGNGKTTLIHHIASQTKSKLVFLDYSKIEAENTAGIAKNITKFFANLCPGDIILFEDSDSYMKGHAINHFVKNALISQINIRNDLFFVIETNNPADYSYDITRHTLYTIALKNLSNSRKVNFLEKFLSEYSFDLPSNLIAQISLAGLSIKDVKQIAMFTFVLVSSGDKFCDALIKACNIVHENILNQSISSESIFRAMRPKYTLDQIILPKEKIDKIKYATKLILNIPLIYDQWNFSAIDPHPRSIINFFGEPGTGKSMSAHAIANMLGKDLLALNYAEVESKYIGEAPKKLESAFAFAKQHDCVMFFDEADSFLGKRIENVTHSADQALNSLRSTMLIQLEQFEGVVIFASNLRENYDKAFHSRFLYEIEFELPSYECRGLMISSFFSKITPLYNFEFSNEDLKTLAIESDGLSGRHIKACILETLNKIASNDFEVFPAKDLFVEMLIKTFKDNKSQNLNIQVRNNDIEEDKNMISEAISKEYASGSNNVVNNNKFIPLINIAYYASFADNNLDESELSIIKETQQALGVEMKDISSKEDLPDINSVILDIKDNGLEKQSIELVARIVAADLVYSNEEKSFIESFALNLNLSQNQIKELHSFVDHLIIENEMLSKIF